MKTPKKERTLKFRYTALIDDLDFHHGFILEGDKITREMIMKAGKMLIAALAQTLKFRGLLSDSSPSSPEQT